MGATETQITRLALGFLIGITIVSFIILRTLAFINRKRNQNSSNVQEKKETSISKAEWTKIYNAQNIVETEQLVEILKQNGIAAFSTGSRCECCNAWGTWIWNIWCGYIRENR